jgi:hypothetical protein
LSLYYKILHQGGDWLYNHNWVEFFDDIDQTWVFVNVPPETATPNTGLPGCSDFSETHGCGYVNSSSSSSSSPSPNSGCESAWNASSTAGGAMQDHEILAATWALPQDDGLNDDVNDDSTSDSSSMMMKKSIHGGPVINAGHMALSDGTMVSPLVWSPNLRSPLGLPLKDFGLRFVNRTDFYRCKP